MIPYLLRISIIPAVPRTLMLAALFVLLLAAALGLLVRATTRIIAGVFGAGLMIAALVMWRPDARSPVTIQATPFGVCLCLSIVLGGCLLFRSARVLAIPREVIALRFCAALVCGLLGARIGYWLVVDGASTGWRDIASFRHGGLLGFGAYLGGVVATTCIIRDDRQGLARWLDETVVPLLLGIALTRVGCYLEGCDFGRPLRASASPMLVALGTFPRWPVTSGDHYFGSPAWANHVLHWGLSTDAPFSLPVHPVQLYEAAFALGVFLVVVACKKYERPAGALFLATAVTYSLGYFLLGFLRGDLSHIIVLNTRLRRSVPLGSHEQLVALGACLFALLVRHSWKHDQAFFARLIAFFRAATTKKNA